MKLVAINSAIQGYDYDISKVTQIIYNTMLEIGEHIEEFMLIDSDISFCDGSKLEPELAIILQAINNSDGVIFISPTHLSAPNALMQTFLEYFSLPIFKNILKNKNCMIVTVGNGQGQRACMEYFSNIVNTFGGYDSIRLPLNYNFVKNIYSNKEDKETLEKFVEDFYRICKQGKKYFIPLEDSALTLKAVEQKISVQSSSVDSEKNINETKIKKPDFPQINTNKQESVSKLYGKAVDNFKTKQADDLDEITKIIFNKKTKVPVLNEVLVENRPEDVKPRPMTCKQLTQNLVHYYQPHLEPGFEAVFQINISGEENFECYLLIEKGTCECIMGTYPEPSVTILAKDKEWRAILEKNISTHRAFMTGQIRVRGNFALLSKFDTLFKR